VVLPVVWVPADLPEFMKAPQLVPKEISAAYLNKGLRDFARFDRASYDRCVAAFAAAIVDAWKKYGKKMKALASVPAFENVPNAFAGGKWEEAVGPDGGWLPGPEVANFIFVADSRDDSPELEARYGANSSEWRPYFPREPETVLDHATKAVKKQFRFREIRINEELPGELERAKKRKNLSIVIGEPKALGGDVAAAIEQTWWEGAAVLLPFHEKVFQSGDHETAFRSAFPFISQISSPNVARPRTPAELQAVLDSVLTRMSKQVTQPEIDSREKTETPPPGLSGIGDTPA
jgi:hypothetical protein